MNNYPCRVVQIDRLFDMLNLVDGIAYRKEKWMKKIALITTNKIFAQSLDAAVKAAPELGIDFFLLLNPKQALLDAEIFEIDVALIDVLKPLLFCERLHHNLPNCHLLLLVSQEDMISREIAIQAKEKGVVEDFVFYDASLKYLFAKLTAFK